MITCQNNNQWSANIPICICESNTCFFSLMTENEAITYALGKFTMTQSYWRINYNVVKWPYRALCVNSNIHNVKWEIDRIWLHSYLEWIWKRKVGYTLLRYSNTRERGNLHYTVHCPFSRQPEPLLWVSLYLTHIRNRNLVFCSIGTLCSIPVHLYCSKSVFLCSNSSITSPLQFHVSPTTEHPWEQCCVLMSELVIQYWQCSILIFVPDPGTAESTVCIIMWPVRVAGDWDI